VKNLVKNTIFSLLTLFYLLSVLEVNAYGVQNTFFDEYDTYIESKEQNFNKANIEQKKDNENTTYVFSIKNIFLFGNLPLFQPLKCKKLALYKHSQNLQNRKLTLLHSVWRI
jgi:hypothetical protein